MKKLIFILSFFALAAFTSPPVATVIYSGDKITVGSTETEYQFGDVVPGNKVTLTIEALSDSIRFSSGRTITNSKCALAAGDKMVITVTNGVTNAGSNGTGNLRAKGNGAGKLFRVSH